MERKIIEEKISELIEPKLEEVSLELVEVEYVTDGGHIFVKIYIDSENGVALDECEKASRHIEKDVDALITEKFFLEVSSPGLERPLKKDKDFVKHIGEKVNFKLKKKFNGEKRVIGILKSFEEGVLEIELPSTVLKLEKKEIEKAKLHFEF